VSVPPQPRAGIAPRVLVADDSAFMRKLLSGTLADGGFDVVGAARDGDEALRMCVELSPDVLTLDLAMPGLDGIAVLRELRRRRLGIPVVVVSAFSPAHGARAVDALAEGAFDLVAKPAAGEALGAFGAELCALAATAATATPEAGPRGVAAPTPIAPRRGRITGRTRGGGGRIVVVACSTGGPKALASFVPALPAPLGGGSLLVQHMPPGFTSSLAARLDRGSALSVREAVAGDRLDGDTMLMAPGGQHLRLAADGGATLTGDDPVGGLRPRADLTITDAAKIFRDRVVLVVLTGMGRDGLEGARAVRAAGGRVLVEAEATCTVYGMPRAIAEAGLADAVLPLHELPRAVTEEVAA
jgi:two-component system chemotaxis response regulator CheB